MSLKTKIKALRLAGDVISAFHAHPNLPMVAVAVRDETEPIGPLSPEESFRPVDRLRTIAALRLDPPAYVSLENPGGEWANVANHAEEYLQRSGAGWWNNRYGDGGPADRLLTGPEFLHLASYWERDNLTFDMLRHLRRERQRDPLLHCPTEEYFRRCLAALVRVYEVGHVTFFWYRGLWWPTRHIDGALHCLMAEPEGRDMDMFVGLHELDVVWNWDAGHRNLSIHVDGNVWRDGRGPFEHDGNRLTAVVDELRRRHGTTEHPRHRLSVDDSLRRLTREDVESVLRDILLYSGGLARLEWHAAETPESAAVAPPAPVPPDPLRYVTRSVEDHGMKRTGNRRAYERMRRRYASRAEFLMALRQGEAAWYIPSRRLKGRPGTVGETGRVQVGTGEGQANGNGIRRGSESVHFISSVIRRSRTPVQHPWEERGPVSWEESRQHFMADNWLERTKREIRARRKSLAA